MAGGIFIGLGANLPSPAHGAPANTITAAIWAIGIGGVIVRAQSPFYESEPVPASGQPWYVNAVIEAESDLTAVQLLGFLASVEKAFGRTRGEANAARILDLDLLDCRGERRDGPEPPILPHPRLAGRAFVLRPLSDVAPDWRDPASGRDVRQLLGEVPPGQRLRRLD